MFKIDTSSVKNILDGFLVLNLFVIILGFFLFLLGVVFSTQGYLFLYQFFQKLWFPLFIPALSTFFTAILIQGIWGLFSKK